MMVKKSPKTGSLAALPISQGRKIWSKMESNTPQIKSNTPAKGWSCTKSQMAPGTQTEAAPKKGMKELMKATMPKRKGSGTPVKASPAPVKSPCTKALMNMARMTAVTVVDR